MQPNPLRIFAAWAIGLVMAAHGAGAAAAAPLPVVKPVASCASLASLDLSDVGGAGSRVTSATETTATINGAPVRFCTVEGTLAPAIGFRVRLPVEGWTQRYLHMGPTDVRWSSRGALCCRPPTWATAATAASGRRTHNSAKTSPGAACT
jgi:hypothetical protein